MRVTSLSLTNFRSFTKLDNIALGQLTVLIGPNNAGKSSILKALYMLQGGHGNVFADVRMGSTSSQIVTSFEDLGTNDAWMSLGSGGGVATVTIVPSGSPGSGSVGYQIKVGNTQKAVSAIPAVEPTHLIVPYLSKRKSVSYDEDVRESKAISVGPQFTHLAAKLSRLGNSTFPGHDGYVRTCKEILGFVVTAVPSANGQRPGVYLPDRRMLPIDQMGEGVPNIVGLLAELALAQGKLFLIEEPENDLHPKALKALLDLVVESSAKNQFVVSTHSNIVARHLCSDQSSLLYRVASVEGSLPPEATITLIPPTPEARLAVMRDLGYSLADFDLWDGWLILEESSAERIIRDYLIPWFAPRLSRIRTISAGGVDKVEPTVEDFSRIVRFMHLEDAYRGTSWVRVDQDARGSEVIQSLRKRFPSWDSSRFGCFPSSQFETFYPAEFQERVQSVLALPAGVQKREGKRLLLDEVRSWLDADNIRGRAALEKSAASIIDDLRVMERQLPH